MPCTRIGESYKLQEHSVVHLLGDPRVPRSMAKRGERLRGIARALGVI